MRYYFLPVAAVLMLWIHEGLGLNCYQCSSDVDPDCKEDFDWAHLDTLTIKSTLCTVDQAKYCIKTTGVWGGIVGTQRFCSSRDMFNQCQYVTYADHNRIYRACIYTCGSSDCNAAISTATASILTVFVATFISMIYICMSA